MTVIRIEMLVKNPPATATAIAQFERSRNLTLPTSYKDFLMSSNGGVPKHSIFPVGGANSARLENVQVFLGIGVNEPTSELAYAYDLYAGGFPEGIVPIAHEDTGSFTCLDLRSGRDKVTFWDKRHFWSTGVWRETDLYSVADSFEEFISLLRPNPF